MAFGLFTVGFVIGDIRANEIAEGIRRGAIALYLLSFLLGLGSIIQVLRFQSARIRQLVDEPRRDG